MVIAYQDTGADKRLARRKIGNFSSFIGKGCEQVHIPKLGSGYKFSRNYHNKSKTQDSEMRG